MDKAKACLHLAAAVRAEYPAPRDAVNLLSCCLRYFLILGMQAPSLSG